MAGFLTDEWIEALADAARNVSVPGSAHVVIQQVVLDADHEVAYAVELDHGRLQVRPGRAERADVTFTQDRATATSIARGELSAQRAFLEGRLTLQGDLSRVLPEVASLSALDDVFAATRATTEW